jgi:hypothetical protein
VPEPTPPSEQRKSCIKCGALKPLSAFGSRGAGRTRNDCKPCVAAFSRERYQRSPEVRAKHKVLRDRWRAENPTYLAEYYQANRESLTAAAAQYAKDHPRDSEQVRRRQRQWYAANRERERAKGRAWREANSEAAAESRRRAQSRRRARLRALPSEPYTMAQLIERDGTCCVLCGEELDLTVCYPELLAPTVEHLECIVWPDSAGDVLSNVAVSHWDCNNRRRDKPHPAAARKRAELLAAAAQSSSPSSMPV